jgi:thiol-disulfide isomerase/thioredoxin
MQIKLSDFGIGVNSTVRMLFIFIIARMKNIDEYLMTNQSKSEEQANTNIARKAPAILISVIAVIGLTGIGYYIITHQEDNLNAIPNSGTWIDIDLLNKSLPVPDWSFTMAGNHTITMNELRGNLTVIDFMATWCSACEIQNEDMLTLYQDLGDVISLFSLTIDVRDTLQMLDAYMTLHGLTWPHGVDTDMQATLYLGISAVPTIVIIDASGLLRWIHEGTWSYSGPRGMNETIYRFIT